MRTTGIIAVVLMGAWLGGCCKKTESSGSTSEALPVATPATTPSTSFAGAYSSNWGTTTFEQTGSSVTAKYPGGRLACIAVGNRLTCDWMESGGRGKATLTKNVDGTITGTWGNGSSATNGGPWRFTPKP